MQYFDFHVHIILKQLFDDNPNIDARMNRNDIGGIPRLCTELPNIIQTQVHQSQLANFKDEVLTGVVLHSLESNLASQVMELRNFLKPESRHKLSLTLLEDIVANKYTYFTNFLVSRTLDNYLNAPLSFNIISKTSFDSPLPLNKVNIFFVVEGAHSLVNSSNTTFPPEEILTNLDKLLQTPIRIVSVNPTHLQQSNLCNHAFGIQLTKSDPFYPVGNGLTDDGRKVIQGLFDKKICVDQKHMSYKSRQDLRNEITSGKFNNCMPVICSHTGFTGIKFEDWPGYITRRIPTGQVYYLEIAKTMQTVNMPQRPGAPAFNMTSINLFNEEIVWIVKNGGVIGLSLDRRIMGYIDLFDDTPTGRYPESLLYVDKEFFSKTEWQALGLEGKEIRKLIWEGDCVVTQDVEDSTSNIPARDVYYYDHYLLHLKHFFQVCADAGIPIVEAQKHITLGSDFDGLIDPFINIQTVEDIPALKHYIKLNFRYYLQTLTDSKKWEAQLDVDKFCDDLFFNNGYDFIKTFFQNE